MSKEQKIRRKKCSVKYVRVSVFPQIKKHMKNEFVCVIIWIEFKFRTVKPSLNTIKLRYLVN